LERERRRSSLLSKRNSGYYDSDSEQPNAIVGNVIVFNFSNNLLSQIPPLLQPSNLLVILLGHNSLYSFDELEVCINVIEIDMSFNNITQTPRPATAEQTQTQTQTQTKVKVKGFFQKLSKLKILRLNSNQISDWRSVMSLQDAPSLLYLTLHSNPFSNNDKYRPFLVNLIPHLKALDLHVTTDEELIENASFPPRFKACNNHMEIPARITSRQYNLDNDENNWNYLKIVNNAIHNLHFINSPVRLLQSAYRRHAELKIEHRAKNAAALVIQKLGAYRIYQKKLQDQLDDLLIEKGYSSLLLSRRQGLRVEAAVILQTLWRENLFHKKQVKAVALVWKWFQIKQAKFKEVSERWLHPH